MAKSRKNISLQGLYAAGSLTPSQAHEVERTMLNEPLWSDAAEGLIEHYKKTTLTPTPSFMYMTYRQAYKYESPKTHAAATS
jgi:hypothetical protein